MKNSLRFAVPLLLVGALAAIPLSAASAAPFQEAKLEFPAASPKASVREQVGLATVEIEYSRPSAKGRKIFGGLVPYGQVWRTGANGATKFTVNNEVKLGGEVVPAGTYALFTIPGESEWTVILNKVAGQWGSYSYDAKNDLVRVKAKPSKLAEPVETFTIGVAGMHGDSAQLTLAWDTTRVAVPIQNDVAKTLVPQIEAAMAAPGNDKPYFPAAMFYYENNLDLKKASAWMDEAIKQQPDALWMIYRKGLILAKAGDKAGARECAEKSLAMATKAGGELGAEYKRLCDELIARTK